MTDTMPPNNRPRPPHREPDNQPMVTFMSFRMMITPAVVQVVFPIGSIIFILGGLFQLLAGLIGDHAGVTTAISGVLTMIVGPIALRLTCEAAVILFRIGEAVEEMRGRGDATP